MPDLTVESIGCGELPDVYPLVRAATRVSLDRWTEFGAELLRQGGGVLAVKAPDECVHGMAAYRPTRDLRHDACLDVEVIVAFDLRGDDRIRKALCRELDRIAKRRGCKAVNFTVSGKSADPASPTRAGLERMGLRLDAARFVREMTAVTPQRRK